jgi:putative tryptophan/tyrosine transport system substrate-binding protein
MRAWLARGSAPRTLSCGTLSIETRGTHTLGHPKSAWAAPIAVSAALLVTSVLAACGSDANSAAQSVRQVGLMHVGLDHVPPSLQGIADGLEELGWDLPDSEVTACVESKRRRCTFEGENLELIWRNLDKTEAQTQADAFVRQGVDVIVAYEDGSIKAAEKATFKDRIPIVFLHPNDPVRAGLVESLASPRANLTGVFGARDLVARQLEIYTQIAPGLERVLALVDPDDSGTEYALQETRKAAKRLGVELVVREATEAPDVRRVFRSLRSGEVDAVMLLSASLRLYHTALTLQLAKRAGLPVQAHRKDWVEDGALFSYGSDLYPIGFAAARWVDSILDGKEPKELGVDEITDIQFALNLATARRLGIKIPKRMVVQADFAYYR